MNYDYDKKSGGMAKNPDDPQTSIMTSSLNEGEERTWDCGDRKKTPEQMLTHFKRWESMFVSVHISYLTTFRSYLLNHCCFTLVLLHASNSVLFCFSTIATWWAQTSERAVSQPPSQRTTRTLRTLKSKKM